MRSDPETIEQTVIVELVSISEETRAARTKSENGKKDKPPPSPRGKPKPPLVDAPPPVQRHGHPPPARQTADGAGPERNMRDAISPRPAKFDPRQRGRATQHAVHSQERFAELCMVRMGDASIRARQIPADSRYRLDDLSRTGCTSPDYYSLTSLYQVGGERRVARALSPAALSSRSLGQSRSVTPTKSDVTVQRRWLQDEC